MSSLTLRLTIVCSRGEVETQTVNATTGLAPRGSVGTFTV